MIEPSGYKPELSLLFLLDLLEPSPSYSLTFLLILEKGVRSSSGSSSILTAVKSIVLSITELYSSL